MGQCLSIVSALAVELAEAKTETTPTTTPAGGNTTTATAGTAAASPSTPSAGGVNPYYKTLPSGVQKHTIHHVYDGDTLTLTGDKRVRLLGVDTPEMKPTPQPYAEEAKSFTKSNCRQNDQVWILSAGEDHYGRMLGHAFVESQGGQYLCINEGLVSNGFAFAYIPDKKSKPFNWDKLIKLQSDARTSKRGLWQSFEDKDVVKTANGSAYHERSCEHVSTIKHLQTLKVSEAADLGLHPCRTCMG